MGSVSSTVSRRRQISHGEGRHPTYLSAVFNGPPESEPPPKRWTVFKRRQTSIHTDVSSALESPCTDLDEPTHGPATDEQPAALENNTNTSPTAENDHKYGLAPAEQSTSLRSIDIHQSSDPDRSGASLTLSVDSPYLTEETEPTEYNLTPIQEPTKPLSPIASVKVSRSYVSWFYPEEHQPPPLQAHNSLDTPSISKQQLSETNTSFSPPAPLAHGYKHNGGRKIRKTHKVDVPSWNGNFQRKLAFGRLKRGLVCFIPKHDRIDCSNHPAMVWKWDADNYVYLAKLTTTPRWRIYDAGGYVLVGDDGQTKNHLSEAPLQMEVGWVRPSSYVDLHTTGKLHVNDLQWAYGSPVVARESMERLGRYMEKHFPGKAWPLSKEE